MSYKVIIIDDEPWTRSVIKHLGNWSQLGLEVVAEASDGEYGYQLITSLRPDIIISDIKMPHLDGIELLKKLRGEKNNAKVIIISGFDDFMYTKSAIQLKANDYLLKPIRPEELNEQLERCVEELMKEGKKEQKPFLDLNGFMNVKWIKNYMEFRSAIYDCLCLINQDAMNRNFIEMEEFILSNERNKIEKSLIIFIYYDLHNSLQRFIVNSGHSVQEIFEEEVISFVFSQECTLEDTLAFIKNLYSKTLVKVSYLRKTRSRINIKQIENYIHHHYLSSITLEQTAKHFFITKEYLSKVFKEETGMSFSDYVLNLRMEKAKELVIKSKAPIKDVGNMLGYSDLAHFYKVFKKYFGITPGEMQKRLK